MNAQITSLLTAVAVLGTSATAQAGRRNDNTDYADVISSRPIYTDVRVSVPREECYQEKVVYDDGYRGRDNSGVGAVLMEHLALAGERLG